MYTILVTGVGAIIGYGIVKSLKKCEYDVRIIGIDIYEDAVGKEWCDTFYQAVHCYSDEYPEFLESIIRKYSVDLIISGIEQEIEWIATHYDNFKNVVDKIALNRPELIILSSDKWFTYEKLLSHNHNCINSKIEGTFLSLSEELGLPFLLKPRKSYASRGIVKINNEEDFLYWSKKSGQNVMYQEIVGNEEVEYTVGLFGLGDGKVSDLIMFNRRLNADGSTKKAKTFYDSYLENEVLTLSETFQPLGPTNFQFRYHNGQFLLLEINPRISSSTSLRTAFGYNEAEMCIEFYLLHRIPIKRSLLVGTAIRYQEDMVRYDRNYI
jgi:carbamoyl-phosphate synthase large subunit